MPKNAVTVLLLAVGKVMPSIKPFCILVTKGGFPSLDDVKLKPQIKGKRRQWSSNNNDCL